MMQPRGVLDQHLASLARACRKYAVRRLELFGSAARGGFDPARSDFDFVVTFRDKSLGTYADRYFDLATELERLLGRKVDLLTERSIRNPYFRREVDAARQTVYDERDEEAAA